MNKVEGGTLSNWQIGYLVDSRQEVGIVDKIDEQEAKSKLLESCQEKRRIEIDKKNGYD